MVDTSFETKLPVFTTPHQQITFYADDSKTHKQILSIMNPYDFSVKFKILVSSSDCSKYTVSVPHGTIKAHHSADVILQHVAATASNIGIVDKVRVLLYGSPSGNRLSGKKDLTVTLLDSGSRERVPSFEGESFQQLEANPDIVGHLRQQPFPLPYPERRSSGKLYTFLVISICLIILMLPKEGDFSEYYPDFLPRPTMEFKLVVTFLLGMFVAHQFFQS